MTERSASRKLAAAVVDDLKSRGHVLLVKGGTEGLVRELEGLVEAGLTDILPLIEDQPFEVVGEVTSTFGSEDVDEQVESLVEQLTARLMDSDHVEDVFAEDQVIGRDIFRALRAGLQSGLLLPPDDIEERAPISVRLETLGYVAATVSKRADDETLRDALERAALSTEGQLTAYDAKVRQAFFEVPGDDPDRRLDIEEAVADELSDLARAGLVELPTIERRIPLPRKLNPLERAVLVPRVEAIASRTLLASGAIATCRVGLDAVTLVFTPLSERDGGTVDDLVAAFAEELHAIVDDAPPTKVPGSRRPASEAPATKSSGPKSVAPKSAAPKSAAPKSAAPKSAAPKSAAPKSAAPKSARPPPRSRRAESPDAAPPTKRAASIAPPKSVAPKSAAPKSAAPKSAKSAAPKSKPPKSAKPTAKPTAKTKPPPARAAAPKKAQAKKSPSKTAKAAPASRR